MILFAADHGGFELKKYLLAGLEADGYEVKDMGAYSHNPEDDYPDFVVPAMEELQKDPGTNKAVVLCRNGVGVCVAANKFPNVRCVLSFSEEHAKSARMDDNANVLALPADYISEEEALKIVKAWLSTPFSNEDRHIRRLNKVSQIEN